MISPVRRRIRIIDPYRLPMVALGVRGCSKADEEETGQQGKNKVSHHYSQSFRFRETRREVLRERRAVLRTTFFAARFRPRPELSRPMIDFITASTAASAAAVAAAVAALMATRCTRAALDFAAPTMERCVLPTKLLLAMDDLRQC